LAPVGEADGELGAEVALVDPGLDLCQCSLCLATILAGTLSVKLASFADDEGRPAGRPFC
jgi:hypothetical protein